MNVTGLKSTRKEGKIGKGGFFIKLLTKGYFAAEKVARLRTTKGLLSDEKNYRRYPCLARYW
jgi:hypothetical protein